MTNERDGSDFWNYPDWSGGDNLRSGAEPFWMIPPDVKVEMPDMIPTSSQGVPVFRNGEFFLVLPGEEITVSNDEYTGRRITFAFPWN